jgi:glycosyltransferase involved in cell wall biosynthesis
MLPAQQISITFSLERCLPKVIDGADRKALTREGNNWKNPGRMPMKIIQVHNWYRTDSGENVFVEGLINLLQAKGEELVLFERNSKELPSTIAAKISAFIAGIYSPASAREMTRLIEENRPDVVHVHNLYPLISPSVLVACARAGVPVVMTSHNYRLTCPLGPHYNNRGICEQCSDGREYWCILNNCRASLFESAAYAIRNAVARKFRLFKDNVTLFIALSQHVKSRLVESGYDSDQVVVIPNMISLSLAQLASRDYSPGNYVGYLGRISPEKGVRELLRAAALNPSVPVVIAGDDSAMPELLQEAPENVRFLGPLERNELTEFYRNARFLVTPSVCFETFGLVAAEAMSQGIPVISSSIGGLPEIVTDGVNGLLSEPGDVDDLAKKIKLLWENPDLCRQMGEAGRGKALREYSGDIYYRRLITAYQTAINLKRGHGEEDQHGLH